jgi:hypothetical protein
MSCFACGAAFSLAAGERVGFRDECAGCGRDFHVCRNCQHHDPSAYNECRESSAERVSDRERANRCDYFALTNVEGPAEGSSSGVTGQATGEESARTALESLFKKP